MWKGLAVFLPRLSTPRNPTRIFTSGLFLRQQSHTGMILSKLLPKSPRHLGVLKLAAEKAAWGKPLPHGVNRGIAVVFSYGSYVAEVAEVPGPRWARRRARER